tara:strand:- start:544 stop:972 length:429 start_codon:yes stop_codon:yes gene_type:complete
MSAMTNYLENALIDHLFRATAYSHSSPASWYIGLHTAAFGEDGSGGTEVSTSGTNYARVGVVRGTGTWRNDTAGDVKSTSNTSAITFAIPSANWGQITHVGIWDAASSGNLIIEAQLQFAKNINNGDPAPQFNAQELKFTFD